MSFLSADFGWIGFLATIGGALGTLYNQKKKEKGMLGMNLDMEQSRLRNMPGLAIKETSKAGASIELEGTQGGYQVHVALSGLIPKTAKYQRGSVRLEMADLGLRLNLTAQHIKKTTDEGFAEGAVTEEDYSINPAAFMNSRSPHELQRFFDRKRRVGVGRLIGHSIRGHVTDTEIVRSISMVTLGSNGVANILSQVVKLADSLAQRKRDFRPEPVDIAEVRARLLGSIKSSQNSRAQGILALLAERVKAHPDSSPKRETAPPERVTRDRILDVAAASAPDVPSHVGPVEVAELVEAEPADDGHLGDSAEPVNYAQLREELFESGAMPSEITGAFEAGYKGRSVQWMGTLRRISSYHSDSVFEGGAGAIARVELEGVADGSFTRRVSAVVQLPVEAAQEFAGRYDIEVEIKGALLRCDPFLCDVFVAGGEMVERA